MENEKTALYVKDLVDRTRKAQAVINDYTQEQVDELVGAIAYGMSRPEVVHELAELALNETKLGDYDSKVGKVNKKVRGVYHEIKNVKTVGVVDENPAKGMRKIAKPVGVIGALIPSTQPEMLPITKALFGIKARNALVFCPHPRGKVTTIRTTELMRDILAKYNAPQDLLVCCDQVSIAVTDEVMKQTDLVIATGGAGMVKAAYSSGTPAFGVGAGNAILLCDDTADLKASAKNTMISKTGDLAAGCSCDNSIIIFENVYDAMIAELKNVGGYLCNAEEKAKVQKALFPNWPADHILNRDIVASPIENITKLAGINVPEGTRFIMVEETGSGHDHPFSGEKMSLVLAVYKCKDLDDGIRILNACHAYSGAGHSCGIYSKNDENILKFALATKTTRVNVNMPNSVVNTGDWSAGHPMTGSLGCGTWGGNIVSENIVLKHYMNNTWLSMPITPVIPTDEELFGDLKLK